MARAIVNEVSFESDAPCEVHSVTWNGRSFRAESYTLAALFAFQEWLDREHPDWYVYVIQGAWNTGVAASAGTHDKAGVIDLAIVNRKTGEKLWLEAQKWLRQHHFYAWWRHTGSWASQSSWHIHQITVGITEVAGCPVGEYVPGQIADAKAGRTGLAGHEADPTWRPKVYTPFPYKAWVAEKEDDMASPKDWTKEDWAAFNKNVSAQVEKGFTKKMPMNGLTIRQTVVRIGRKVGIPNPEQKKAQKKAQK